MKYTAKLITWTSDQSGAPPNGLRIAKPAILSGWRPRVLCGGAPLGGSGQCQPLYITSAGKTIIPEPEAPGSAEDPDAFPGLQRVVCRPRLVRVVHRRISGSGRMGIVGCALPNAGHQSIGYLASIGGIPRQFGLQSAIFETSPQRHEDRVHQADDESQV